jgi:hypothetical protein
MAFHRRKQPCRDRASAVQIETGSPLTSIALTLPHRRAAKAEQSADQQKSKN